MYTYSAELIRVIDGDTLDLRFDLGFDISKVHRVRILGINAPETRTKDLEEKARGLAAKEFLRELLPLGDKKVYVRSVKKNWKKSKDSFGRYLAHIATEEGYDIGKKMIDTGHAVEYRKGK